MALPKRPLTSAQNALRNVVKETISLPSNPVKDAKRAIRSTAKNLTSNAIEGTVKEAVSAVRSKVRSEAKQRSDYIYNERRRAKRLVARLEKDITFMTGAEKKATRQYINALQREIQKTYAPRKGTRRAEERQMAAVENLRRATYGTAKNKGLTKKERQQRIFAHQMNLATRGLNSTLGVGEIGRGKVKIFMRATQDIWQGLPNDARFAVIESFYGMSIEEVFDMVMEGNESAIEALEQRAQPIESTDENAFYYEEEQYNQEAGSPDYLDFVVTRVFVAV